MVAYAIDAWGEVYYEGTGKGIGRSLQEQRALYTHSADFLPILCCCTCGGAACSQNSFPTVLRYWEEHSGW